MLKNTDYKCAKTNVWKPFYTDLGLNIIDYIYMHLYKTDLNNSGLCDLCEELGFDM